MENNIKNRGLWISWNNVPQEWQLAKKEACETWLLRSHSTTSCPLLSEGFRALQCTGASLFLSTVDEPQWIVVSKRYHPQCKIHDSVSVCQFLYDLTSYLKSIYIDFYSTGVVHISIYVHNPGCMYDCFIVQQGLESRDTLPLGARTLKIHNFELVPKTLEICRFKQIFW